MSSRTTTAVPGPLQASNKRHNAWPSHAGYDAGMKLPQSLNSVAAFAAIVLLTACAQAPAPASALTSTLWLVDPAAARGPVARKTVTVLPGVGRVGGWVDAEVSPDEQRLAITRCVSAIESQGWLISQLSGPKDGSIDGPRASQRRKLQPAAAEAPQAAHFVGHWTADRRAPLPRSERDSEFRELLRPDLAGGGLTAVLNPPGSAPHPPNKGQLP